MHAARTNSGNLLKVWLVAMGLVVVALSMGARPASGQQATDRQYSITDLDTLGADSSAALGINNRGQVVGDSATASGQSHAVLWSKDGEMTDLGTLPGADLSFAFGINYRGQVVGFSYTASGVQAVLWSK